MSNQSSAPRLLMAGGRSNSATDDQAQRVRARGVSALRPESRGGSPPEPHAVLGRRAVVVLCVATIGFSGLGLRQAWTDGPTYDEATELTAALTALTRHDLRATPQHPPLFRELAAAPLLLWRPYVPGGPAWERGSGHDLAAQLMHHEAVDGHLRRDLFVVRVLPVVETVAVAWLLALLAGELFGSAAGLLAAVLWLVDPFVIGLGHLDGIDIPATLTTVLVALAVLAARRNPTRRAVVVVGLCGGLAVLARLTGVLVVVVAAMAVAAAADPSAGDERRDVRRAAAVRGVTVMAVAWATVMFAYVVLSPVDVAPGRPGAAGLLAVVGHVALPPEWWRGTRHLLRVGSEPGPAFVLGRAHTGRWLWFWPASLAVKLPPTTLFVLATIPLTWAHLGRAVRREAAWVVALPAVAYTLFTVQQQRPIGLRYLTPALALGIVAAAPIATVLGGFARRAAVAVAVGGALVASLAAPSLAWTNPLFGPGYQAATDSNLDWGQSYPALRRWSAGHHPWVAYFGPAGLGVDTMPGARDLSRAPDGLTGWVAVSASSLTAYDRDELAWLRAYCPVRVLDRTVLIYRFTAPPDRTRRGPPSPSRPCAGGVSELSAASSSPGRPGPRDGTPS